MSDLVKVTLPDGSQKEAARGTTILDFVKGAIGPGLAKAAYIAVCTADSISAPENPRAADATRSSSNSAGFRFLFFSWIAKICFRSA